MPNSKLKIGGETERGFSVPLRDLSPDPNNSQVVLGALATFCATAAWTIYEVVTHLAPVLASHTQPFSALFGAQR